MVWFSWFHFSVWFAECSIRINWICWLKPGWVEFIQFNRKANKGKTRSNGAKNGLLEFGLIFNLIFTLFCLLISEVQSLTSEMVKLTSQLMRQSILPSVRLIKQRWNWKQAELIRSESNSGEISKLNEMKSRSLTELNEIPCECITRSLNIRLLFSGWWAGWFNHSICNH